MGRLSMKEVDIEAGNGQLYPGMMENPQMRWSFIRKVYSILCLQLLLTFGIGLAMFLVHPVRDFFRTMHGLYVFLAIMVLAVILIILLMVFSKRHPWNYIISVLFTLAMGAMVGVACNQTKGDTVLVAAGLTVVVTIGLTLFTFLAAKRGADFNFLGPFLMCALLILISFGILQMVFHFGRVLEQVFACIGALVFSAFIIYDTDNLIKRFNYDEYMIAAMTLFLDILNLFLYILQALGGGGDT